MPDFSSEIELHATGFDPKSKFSILIPSWNNLDYLKLCVRSIRDNSSYPHQLILHLNEANDGSREWAGSEGLAYSFSARNLGVCHALNAASSLAQTEYICFFNDDMYALPDWDRVLWEDIQKLNHARWFLSATMIEHRDTGNACVLAPCNYGDQVSNFEEKRLLAEFRQLDKKDWSGATWPPNVVPRSLWEEVGGYSLEFSPGMSSDPDFSMKLWQAGVRHFKGLGQSKVYHFQAKSTGKVSKNNGNRQFLHKWGITQSTLFRYYLRRGNEWKGPQAEGGPTFGLCLSKLRSKLKMLF